MGETIDVTSAVVRGRPSLVARMRTRSLTVDLLVVSGVSLALGLVRLGSPSLWVDEAYTYEQLQKGYFDQFDGYMPFYYWIEKPWTELAGTSEWAMRFPSVVGAMLASALVVVLARKLFDDRVALVSGLLLATSPFFVQVVAAGSRLSLPRGGGHRRDAPSAAGAGTRREGGMGSLRDWHSRPPHDTCRRGTPARPGTRRPRAATPATRNAPLPARLRHHSRAWRAPGSLQLAMRTRGSTSETAWIPFPSAAYVQGSLLGISGAAGFGLVLALFGVWALWRARERDLPLWLGSWAFGPFVFALVISIARPVFVDRYLVVAAPAFAMLAAVGLTSLAGRIRTGATLAVVVATCFGLVLWYQTTLKGNWRGEDWRGAVSFVQSRTRGDVVRRSVVDPRCGRLLRHTGARHVDRRLGVGALVVRVRARARGFATGTPRPRGPRARREPRVRMASHGAVVAPAVALGLRRHPPHVHRPARVLPETVQHDARSVETRHRLLLEREVLKDVVDGDELGAHARRDGSGAELLDRSAQVEA